MKKTVVNWALHWLFETVGLPIFFTKITSVYVLVESFKKRFRSSPINGLFVFFRAGRDLTPQGLFELKILCSEMS